jgi:hypothetical protein
MPRFRKLVYFLSGLLLGGLGFLLVGMGLIGIIDPAGSKMSDDSDPFGPTTNFLWVGSLLVLAGSSFLTIGGYLIWRIDKKG